MLDLTKILYHALKEFGPASLVLIAVIALAQVGFFTVETLISPVTTGNFIGISIIILMVILICSQLIIKLIKSSKSSELSNITEDIQETKFKTNEIFNLIHNQSGQTDQMHYLLMNIYDVVKGIPNKKLIFENLIIRTRYLLNDCLEIILDFTVTNAKPSSIDILNRHQSKLERDFSKVKTEYMDSITKISRGLIEARNKAEIDEVLNKFFALMYDVTTSSALDIESILFKININLKDLEESLKIMFKTDIIGEDPKALSD
jgi:hypothetical protein